MASRNLEIEREERLTAYLLEAAKHPVKGIRYAKPDTTGVALSGAAIPSEGLTPRRVYSENNGGNYRACSCKTCGNPYRKPEPKGCKPGSLAVKVVKGNACNGCSKPERGNPNAPCFGCKEAEWLLPLGSEYMYHSKRNRPSTEREIWNPRAVQQWILPQENRNARKVAGPCQAIERRRETRTDGQCPKCYAAEMRNIAKGIVKYDNAETIRVRKNGDKRSVRVIRKPIDAETKSVAAVLSTRKQGAKATNKPAHASTSLAAGVNVTNEPRLFGAYYVNKSGEVVKGYAEARTLTDARKLLAMSLGVDASDMVGRNIYLIESSDYGSGESWRRVA